MGSTAVLLEHLVILAVLMILSTPGIHLEFPVQDLVSSQVLRKKLFPLLIFSVATLDTVCVKDGQCCIVPTVTVISWKMRSICLSAFVFSFMHGVNVTVHV